MAYKCKCYCFCSSNVYMLAFEAFAIWLTWNWNIADCLNCLLLRWDFAIVCAFAPPGQTTTKIKESKRNTRVLRTHFRKRNYICRMCVCVEICVRMRVRVRVLISYSKNPFFLLATFCQFLNDLSNLWDGSIINFRYGRKYFGLNGCARFVTACA